MEAVTITRQWMARELACILHSLHLLAWGDTPTRVTWTDTGLTINDCDVLTVPWADVPTDDVFTCREWLTTRVVLPQMFPNGY